MEEFSETYLIGIIAVQPGEHRILEHDNCGACVDFRIIEGLGALLQSQKGLAGVK